ncbi:MAG: hypothetical protein ABIH78_03660 [Candidatus Peregrinibacteria bacterium]
MPNSFKNELKRLPIHKKFVFGGALLAMISVFLPWYKDLDQFNTGDMFLGITGPLYLAGVIVLMASIASFGIILLKLLDKPAPKLPLKEDHFHVLSSGLSLFMMVLSISVFFHHKFGLNLVNKTVGIGMYLDFIGAGFIMLGAIMAVKKSDVSFEEEGDLKPLINLNTEERLQRDINPKEDIKNEKDKIKISVQESIDDFTDGNINHTNDIN